VVCPWSEGKINIDNDSLDEIVGLRAEYCEEYCFNRTLRAMNADTRDILWERKIKDYFTEIDTLRVYDTNGDVIPEVVYNEYGDLYVLNGLDGSVAWTVNHPGDPGYTNLTDVFVGNLDTDPSLEVLWGNEAVDPGPDHLFVYDIASHATDVQSSERYVGPYWDVAFGDLNNDGVTDRVYASREKVTAFDPATSSTLWQVTASWLDNIVDVDALTIADVDNDGTNEVIVSSELGYFSAERTFVNHAVVQIRNAADGSIENSVILEKKKRIYSLHVADIDNDGDLEILAGSSSGEAGGGAHVYVIDGATAKWITTSPELKGGLWDSEYLRSLGTIDMDNDGTLEIVADGHYAVYIIGLQDNRVIKTEGDFDSIATTMDVFSGNPTVYLGAYNGFLHRLSADGSTIEIARLCNSEVYSLVTISPLRLAFSCDDRLAIYHVVDGVVEWQQQEKVDPMFGVKGLATATLFGKNGVFVGGEHAYLFVNGTANPIAEGATFVQPFNRVIDGTLPASDPNGLALVYGIYKQPQHGRVELVDSTTGEFRYTPDGSFLGDISFQFYVSNGSAESQPATVILRLTNTVPVGTPMPQSLPNTSSAAVGDEDDGKGGGALGVGTLLLMSLLFGRRGTLPLPRASGARTAHGQRRRGTHTGA